MSDPAVDDGTCHCTRREFGFTRDITVDFEFWVCGECRNPTELYLARLYEHTDKDG